MTDLVFDIDNIQINIRVGAIILATEQVLICRLKSLDTWYLPGGRISAGETSRDALERELKEEIEGAWSIEEPVASSENFFYRGETQIQEFCTYYRVKWIGSTQKLKVLSHEEFRWIKLDEVEHYPIKPDFVKPLIINPSPYMSYFIHRDN